MLLLCTGGSPPSCLLLVCIQESLSGMPQSLEISLHTFSGEHSLHSSDIEFRLMDVADDIMTHVVICLVYWNR
jgi:hypothetical protein